MLRLSEFLKVAKLKQALRLPFNEGSCFGVHDPGELRPAFNLGKKAKDKTGITADEKKATDKK